MRFFAGKHPSQVKFSAEIHKVGRCLFLHLKAGSLFLQWQIGTPGGGLWTR